MSFDLEHGAVSIFGQLFTAWRGTLIGSSLAAGASSLVVAFREQALDESVPMAGGARDYMHHELIERMNDMELQKEAGRLLDEFEHDVAPRVGAAGASSASTSTTASSASCTSSIEACATVRRGESICVDGPIGRRPKSPISSTNWWWRRGVRRATSTKRAKSNYVSPTLNLVR